MKRFFVLILVALLSGCALTLPPVAFRNYRPTLAVHKNWQHRVSMGTYDHYLNLIPAYANGRVFTVSYMGEIRASDAVTGKRIWQDITHVTLTSAPAAGRDFVYLGAGNGKILALQQNSGHLVWQRQLSSQVLAQPVVTQYYVLVKTEDSKLYALNRLNGRIAWTFSEPGPSLVLRANSAPAVAKGVVVSGFSNGKLVALRLKGGQLLWEKQVAEPKGFTSLSRMVDIIANPQISGHTVYAATFQGRLVALRLTSGRTLWHREFSTYTGLAIAGNSLYATDANGDIWSLNKNSGHVNWRQNGLAGWGISAPVIIGQNLAVGDDSGHVDWFALSDGRAVARKLMRRTSPISSEPTAYQNTLYAYSNDGYLAKFTVAN